MVWKGIDKRRFPRANYRCSVKIRKGRHAEMLSAETENIGGGGIAAILDKPLEIFSEVELTLEEGQPPIHCEGQIVWVVRRSFADKTQPPKYDTGIEFLNLKPEDTERIEAILARLLSEQERRSG